MKHIRSRCLSALSRESQNRLVVCIAVFSLLFGSTGIVQALSQDDLDSIINGTPFYAGNTSQCTTGSTAPLSPGNGSAAGAVFPNLDPNSMANAINAYIASSYPQSDFLGDGTDFVSDGQNSNVSPFLIVALAQNESQIGTPGPLQYDLIHANNAFSRSATSSQPNYPGAGVNADTLWYKWPSVIASIEYQNAQNEQDPGGGGGDMAAYLRYSYGPDLDSDNLSALAATYDPSNATVYSAELQNTINLLATAAGGAPTTTPAAASDDSSCTGTGGGTAAGLSNFVYYSQCDPTWANYPYGDDSPQGTICEDGCGATSVAMVVATLADSTVTPIQTANLDAQLHEYTAGAGTDWSFFSDGPEHYGLKAVDEGSNFAEAIATLNAGGLVIAAGTGADPFTSEGHVIVLKGIDPSNGDIIVADPDTTHTQTEYTENAIISAGLGNNFDMVGVTQ